MRQYGGFIFACVCDFQKIAAEWVKRKQWESLSSETPALAAEKRNNV